MIYDFSSPFKELSGPFSFNWAGSILNYVNQLPDEDGRLMIMHGTMDENVHFMQHTAALINSLVKHGKPYNLQVSRIFTNSGT